MKKKFRAYLYLILSIAAAVIAWHLEKPTEEKKGDILNSPVFATLDTNAVTRIEIEYLSNHISLQKENGEWKINGHKADAGKVGLALDNLIDLSKVSLAGTNPEKHSLFEVDATGLQLKLFDAQAEELVFVYLGKTGPAFTESFLRKEGENEVYLVSRALRSAFPADVNTWRDRTIWDIAAANITEIKIEHAKKLLFLKKDEGKWNEAATPLSKIIAAGFVDDPNIDTGLGNPTMTITLQTNASPYILKLGKQNADKMFFAQKEGEKQIYLLRESFVTTVDKF
ncbi:MAG: DUF4340 domain-containing protein [Deltaproteobacteria bacterium]|nr:DUF4340 domain-containing protein [Deltaproteobacteria bacterium]